MVTMIKPWIIKTVIILSQIEIFLIYTHFIEGELRENLPEN